MFELDFSPVAVTFQAVGTLLLALMLAQLGRIFTWHYAQRWALAWTCMFIAVGSVRIYIGTTSRAWWFLYLVAEWSFLILLFDGCRELVTSLRLPLRVIGYALPLELAFAAIPVKFAADFNTLFIMQSAVVAFGAVASFVMLGRIERSHRTTGWQTMRLSLALLSILYGAYVPLYFVHTRYAAIPFLSYSSLADLLGCVLLGFSMILVTFEEANRELKSAVGALAGARDQLERKLRTDPLTEALSRHAFHSMQSGMTGVVIMIDVDHLKQINDQLGHAAGDAVIRAAANAVRTRIRADDLLFRWGGDEFLVVVPQSTRALVDARLAVLADGVMAKIAEGIEFKFHMSWGAAEFGAETSLDQAMQAADAEMYGRRRAATVGH